MEPPQARADAPAYPEDVHARLSAHAAQIARHTEEIQNLRSTLEELSVAIRAQSR